MCHSHVQKYACYKSGINSFIFSCIGSCKRLRIHYVLWLEMTGRVFFVELWFFFLVNLLHYYTLFWYVWQFTASQRLMYIPGVDADKAAPSQNSVSKKRPLRKITFRKNDSFTKFYCVKFVRSRNSHNIKTAFLQKNIVKELQGLNFILFPRKIGYLRTCMNGGELKFLGGIKINTFVIL